MIRSRRTGGVLAAVAVAALAIPLALSTHSTHTVRAAFLPARHGTAHAAATHAAYTARQLAGQRVIYSYPGLTPPDSLLTHIRAGEAAGVIFFSENVSSLSQLHAVANQLQQAATESPVAAPLLLLTDQEGGEVRRLPGAPESSAKEIGEADDPTTAATDAGTGAAQTLQAGGLNGNLAPVLDVYRTPGDLMDQYGRSYSSDPAAVGTLGSAFISAQQEAGVLAAAKHFPGLGSASADQNTDTTQVTLDASAATLRGTDEKPYQGAIAAGVKMVMTSWAVYPALDPDRPAGLSSTIVNEELRDRLGFTGVTVTDALEATALAPYGGTAKRAVLAAGAGMDLILCSGRDADQGADAVTAMADAYTSGKLDQATFSTAADRVTALRAAL